MSAHSTRNRGAHARNCQGRPGRLER
jgi:hypothetical protein